MQNHHHQPLSNVQLELLKTFSHHLSDQDLLELKKLLSLFFAERLIQRANVVWDEQGWNEAKVEEMLNTKMRKKQKDA